MKRANIKKYKRAFTLIELLVVVAIIAVLVGILIPSLAAAKRQANETGCLANLKSWGFGYTMYASSYDDHLPFTGTGDGETTGAPVAPTWNDSWYWANSVPVMMGQPSWDQAYTTAALSYTPAALGMPNQGSKNFFVCPSVTTVGFHNPTASGSGTSTQDAVTTDNCFELYDGTGVKRDTFWCYVTNSKLDNSITYKDAMGHPIYRRNDMKTSWSTAVFMAEKMMNPSEMTPAAPSTCNTCARGKTTYTRFAARHNGGGNISFVDGHAEYFNLQAISPPSYDQGTNLLSPDGYSSIPGKLVWDPFNACWN